MVLEEIHLTNFRIFDELKVKFDKNINIIYGLNGQGKTSILEAIYYLGITKSFRAKNDEITLKHENEFFEVKGKFLDKDNLENEIRIYYSKHQGKHAFIDKKQTKQYSEVVGLHPIVLLSLEDLNLTFGVPSSRRKFLDVLLSQLFPGYLYNLQKYKKCILQKNKLLNSDFNNVNPDELKIWNQQIVNFGTEIIFQRIQFIKYINKFLGDFYRQIAQCDQNIECLYNSTIGNFKEVLPKDEIERLFLFSLDKNYESELRRQTSLLGPHRDDIDFLKDKFPFKSHGSQGENKSFLLSLKLVESNYVYEILKRNPLMLFDDVFGELDNNRVENLVKLIKGHGQTFITTTDNKKFSDHYSGSGNMIELKNHRIN